MEAGQDAATTPSFILASVTPGNSGVLSQVTNLDQERSQAENAISVVLEYTVSQLLTSGARAFSVMGDCPGHYGVWGSIPGPHLLDARKRRVAPRCHNPRCPTDARTTLG